MSNTDFVVRSVPMGPDGNPADPALKIAGRDLAPAPDAALAHLPGVRTVEQPSAEEAGTQRFDPASFHAGLPKLPEEKRASMAEATRPLGMPPSTPGAATSMRPAPKPAPKFLGKKEIAHDLEDPIEWDGVDFTLTKIRSPLGSVFSDFIALTQEGRDPEHLLIWLVCDLPIEVVETLSLGDLMAIREKGLPFLPRSMRVAMEANASKSDDGTSEEDDSAPKT